MEDTTLEKYALMLSFILPAGMLDWFDFIRVEETEKEDSDNELDVLFRKALHIYLDERDNRIGNQLGLIPNGFTESTVIHDYPVRDRKLVLHVRRRRYLNADKRNIILCNFPLSAEGTRLSVEFGVFLKVVLDNLPVTASSLAKYYHLKGSTLERYYKHHLSDFNDWDQKEHAQEWILLSQNIGERCCIDETVLSDEIYTILSNKDGHCRKGTVIAIIKGTKAQTVAAIINTIPESERARVKEITMDFSDSMYSIAKLCFPNTNIVIDCFHIVQRLCDVLDEMRLRFKRLAVTQTKTEECKFNKEEERKAKQRLYYRSKHKKKPGEKRDRKPLRKKKIKPAELSNGDIKVELLTRARYVLPKSGEKWGENQKKRAKLLFELYPKLKEVYSLVCKVRCIFKDKLLTKKEAKVKLHEWYDEVVACTIREIKSARECIKSKEDEVLNYFTNRTTNAAAESLNSKMKGFKAQLHGVADVPFFMYRLCMVFG